MNEINTIECIVDGRKEARRIERWECQILPGHEVGIRHNPQAYGKEIAVPELKAGEIVEYDMVGKPHITTAQHNHAYYASGGTYGSTAGTFSDNATSNWQYRPSTTDDSPFRFQYCQPSFENPLGIINVTLKEEEEMASLEENKYIAKLTRGMEEEQIDAFYEILECPGWERRVMLAFLASAVKDDNMTAEALGYETEE